MSFDSFDGGNGDNILLMTQGDDIIALDDQISDNPNPGEARVKKICQLYMLMMVMMLSILAHQKYTMEIL